MSRLSRRQVLAAAAVLAAARPAVAQERKVRRVGLLGPTRPTEPTSASPFRQRLAELGHVEGRTIHFETRSADGRPERYPELAAELVALSVDVLVTTGSQATRAAKEATRTIPIVLLGVSHPVESGLVASLARPGGNVTGITDQAGDLHLKLVQIVREVAPRVSRLGVLWDGGNPGFAAGQRETEEAARRIGARLIPVDVRTTDDVEPALAGLVRERAEAMLVGATPTLVQSRERVARFAIAHHLPAATTQRFGAEAGMLVSYSPSWPFLLRRAAEYVDRILAGARPADLPLEQVERFELVVNVETARLLGLTMPPALLLRTDRTVGR